MLRVVLFFMLVWLLLVPQATPARAQQLVTLRMAFEQGLVILDSVTGNGEGEPLVNLKLRNTTGSILTVSIENGTVLRSRPQEWNSFVLIAQTAALAPGETKDVPTIAYVIDPPGGIAVSLFPATSPDTFAIEKDLAPRELVATLTTLAQENRTDFNSYLLAQAAVWRAMCVNWESMPPDYQIHRLEVNEMVSPVCSPSQSTATSTVPSGSTVVVPTTGVSRPPGDDRNGDAGISPLVFGVIIVVLLGLVGFFATRNRGGQVVIVKPPQTGSGARPLDQHAGIGSRPHHPGQPPIRPQPLPSSQPQGHVPGRARMKAGLGPDPSIIPPSDDPTELQPRQPQSQPQQQVQAQQPYWQTQVAHLEETEWQVSNLPSQPPQHLRSNVQDRTFTEDIPETNPQRKKSGERPNFPPFYSDIELTSDENPVSAIDQARPSVNDEVPDEVENTAVLTSSRNAKPQSPTSPQERPWEGKFYLEGIEGKLNGEDIYITARRSIITRRKLAEIVVENASVSAPHALVTIERDGRVQIADLHSSNGTLVNGTSISTDPATLQQDAVIHLGEVELRYDPTTHVLLGTDGSNKSQTTWSLQGKNRWMITRRSLPFIEIDEDQAISSPHAYLDVARGFELRPLKNTNPIGVDDDPEIVGNIDIKPGSKIKLGATTFLLRSAVDKMPDMIGPYRVQGYIAEGGMADVYKVTREDDAQPLVLKLPKQKFNVSEEFRRRWRQEINILKTITLDNEANPNIVGFVDAGVDDATGLKYLVMSFVDGCSLHKIRRYKGQNVPLDLGDAYDVVRQLVRALTYLHKLQIAHCDIKPGNLLFDRAGKLYLTDFGIATRFGELSPRLATRDYMAPEQSSEVKVSAKLDIYALGALMYLLLTGNKLKGDTTSATRTPGGLTPSGHEEGEQTADIRAGSAAAAMEKLEMLPSDIQQLIKRCLAPNPTDRPDDIGEVLGVIDGQGEHGDLAALVSKATTADIEGETVR
jgi:pSer/pThr/pTyr-binding forkhead associated (FHA) protein/tRNA A-37 threonylcarbamoyl transferase component Bud32